MNRRTQRSSRAGGTLLAALLSLTVLTSCAQSEAEERGAIGSMEVRRGTLVSRVILTGVVDAESSMSVAVPRLPSWQTSIQWLAEDGTVVEEGEKIAELDNSTFARDLDDKHLELQELEQSLAKADAEAEANLAESEFAVASRHVDLDKAEADAGVPEEIVSARDYQDRQLALDKARTEFEKATKNLDSSKAAARADRENLLLQIAQKAREIAIAEQAVETMVLRTPRRGILVTGEHPWEGRKLQMGDPVWVGFEIARIPDASSLQIAALLPDVDDGNVIEGMRAVVTLDAYPRHPYDGTISEVAPMANETSRQSLRRAFRVVVDLDAIDTDRMRPGLSARVEIQRQRIDNALIAPRAAIDMGGDSPVLHTRKGPVGITVIGCNANDCAIEGDVEEGVSVRPWRGLH